MRQEWRFLTEIWGSPEVFDIASIERDFVRAKAIFPKVNVFRLWMSLDGYIDNSAGYLVQFNAVLALGAKHDLRFIVTLFNAWQSMPDWGGGQAVGTTDYFLRAPLNRSEINASIIPREAFLQALVLPHARDPAVLVWDVMNEPTPADAHFVDTTAIWLRETARVAAHIGVSSACAGRSCLQTYNNHTNVLIIHPYCRGYDETGAFVGCYPGGAGEDAKLAFSQALDESVRFANQRKLPLIATETCWGSLNDTARALGCSFELGELAKRNIGFTPHGLRYSKVADLHDYRGGPVGPPGYMAFLGRELALRPHHEFYNSF